MLVMCVCDLVAFVMTCRNCVYYCVDYLLLLKFFVVFIWLRGWELQRTGSMEDGDARNGSTGTSQTKGSGVDSPAKPLPPCCVKAMAAAPESEAKCHATVVSGWFTETLSQCGMSIVQHGSQYHHPFYSYLTTEIR